MKDRIRSKRGFTLIELMIVILIVGILAAIAIPQVQKFINRKDQLKSGETIIMQEQEQINDATESSPDSVNETGEMNKL